MYPVDLWVFHQRVFCCCRHPSQAAGSLLPPSPASGTWPHWQPSHTLCHNPSPPPVTTPPLPLSQPLPSLCHNPSPPPVTTPPLSLQEEGAPQYNSEVVTLLLAVLDTATATGQPPLTLRESRVSAPPSLPSGNSIRLVTLRLAIMLLGRLLGESSGPALHDHHIALVESIYESSILQLRLFYKARHGAH